MISLYLPGKGSTLMTTPHEDGVSIEEMTSARSPESPLCSEGAAQAVVDSVARFGCLEDLARMEAIILRHICSACGISARDISFSKTTASHATERQRWFFATSLTATTSPGSPRRG